MPNTSWSPKPSTDLMSERTISWRRDALLTVTVFVVWAVGMLALAPVREIAFAPGELRPSAETVTLKHVHGGEVAEVVAGRDALVAPGATILRLDGAPVAAEIAQLTTRRAHLALRRTRLSALIDEAPFTPPSDAALDPVDIETTRRVYLAERADDASELAAIDAQILERKAGALAVDGMIAALENERAAYDAQLSIARNLEARQVGTRRATLESEARIAEAAARRAELEGRREAAAGAIAQLKSARDQAAARRRAEWSRSLAETVSEIAEIDGALAETRRRQGALEIVSPIAGRVLTLGVETAGDVIAPGGLAARIVPAAADGAPALRAEIRIAPKDVGHVAVGDRAEVVVTTFDSETFGEIAGVVASLSPSSLTAEDGTAYFRGELAIDRTEARVGDAVLRLAPGMQVEARLATGADTLLGYLLQPIDRALEVAFSER